MSHSEYRTKEIEDYCLSVSTKPSTLCEELFAFTEKNVPMSMMLIGPMVGSFLQMMLRAIGAKRVLEVGTFTGYSALAMAEALPEEGELITLDINPETNKIAESFWSRSPHGKKIKNILGPASETFPTLKGPFDFVFIDADKASYPQYFERALELLSPQGLIVCDNCLFSGKVLESSPQDANAKALKAFNEKLAIRSDLERILVPLRDGLFMVRRKRN